MKYCVEYYPNFRHNDEIDEIIYDFNKYGDPIIIDQMKRWREDQRVIINGSQIQNFENFIPCIQVCRKNHNNLAVCVNIQQKEAVKRLREAAIPFFYLQYVNNLEEMYAIINQGVSDIYISENLGFDIVNIGSFCKTKGIKVRVIPNVAQYKLEYKEDIPDPCKFFIRPEDVKEYEPYVDVLEIYEKEMRLSVLYEIYTKQKWIGNLNQLISGLEESIENSAIPSIFGKARLNCKKRCMYDQCSLCKTTQDLSNRVMDVRRGIKETDENKY